MASSSQVKEVQDLNHVGGIHPLVYSLTVSIDKI